VRKKRILMLIGSVCLILVLAALLLPACAKEAPPEVGEPTYHWRMNAISPPEAPDTMACRSFAQSVLEASDGRIVIDVHDSSVLGDWNVVAGEVMKGTIEISMSSLPSTYDPRLEIVYLPYLFETWPQVIVAKSNLLSLPVERKPGPDIGFSREASFPQLNAHLINHPINESANH